MAADPDPPATAGNPPPFTPNDLRISPSGPYIAGAGGGLVRWGADAIVQVIVLPDTAGAFAAIPRSTAPAAPLLVTFPAFDAGDTVWIVWHLSGSFVPDVEEGSAILHVQPTLDVGAGPEFIDGSEVIWAPPATTNADSQSISLAGTAAFKLTNPAQPPLVQLFYSLSGGAGASISIRGAAPAEAFGSCWLTAAELSKTAVFQFPPEVVLTPVT